MPTPPQLLVHLHIPKAGGTTLNSVFRRVFRKAEIFNANLGELNSALWSADQSCLAQKWSSLGLADREAIRCISGGHLPLGVDSILGPSAKFVALVRHPVQRVISHYRFLHLHGKRFSIWPLVREMTFEEYLDSCVDLGPHNFQVRILSGCAELDAPFGSDGNPIAFQPVTAHHFELAKRNIEERFIAIAPLEEFSSLIALLRHTYDWPSRCILFEPLNVNEFPDSNLSASLRHRIEDFNRYDIALFEWISTRFAAQIARCGEQFERERRRLVFLNGAAEAAQHVIPRPVRSLIAKLVLSRSAFDGARTVFRRASLVYRDFLRRALLRMWTRSAGTDQESLNSRQWFAAGALAACLAIGEVYDLLLTTGHIGTRAVIGISLMTDAIGIAVLVYWMAYASLAVSDDKASAAAIPRRARTRIGFGLTGGICLAAPGLISDVVGLLLFTGRPGAVLALSLCSILTACSPM